MGLTCRRTGGFLQNKSGSSHGQMRDLALEKREKEMEREQKTEGGKCF